MNIEQIEPGKILDIYSRVLRIRRFEEPVGLLFSQGQLPGFVHLYIGEEAIAAGVCASLRKDDYIVSTHRGHGHVIAKGGNIDRMMAELFGKSDGYCKGKDGSMHIADFEIGILGACGIVGGGIPIAAGAALSALYRQTDQVAVSFFGDGAANEGSFHESLNLVSTLRLPAVFVCENNQYGEFTPAERAMNIKNIAERAASYGIEGIVTDGSDALAMYMVAERASGELRSPVRRVSSRPVPYRSARCSRKRSFPLRTRSLPPCDKRCDAPPVQVSQEDNRCHESRYTCQNTV